MPVREKSGLAPGDPRHGTHNGYVNYGCHCRRCRKAHALWTQEARLRRRDRMLAGEAEPTHGKASTYRNWMCRCLECTEAHRLDCAHRVQRQREEET